MDEIISKKTDTGIKHKDGQKGGSLLGRKVPSFTYSQIYFDFVPPALNYFEYTMKELASIEQSLIRIGGKQYSKTLVSDYMSFTFVYPDYMDITNASLALFDAEPEEQDDEDNKSRIVVVYLDKEMTFEMLKEITSTTTLPATQGKDVYLCVHSDHFLQDCNTLKSIMATFLGRRPTVLDADTEMTQLYARFKGLSRQILNKIENLYQNVVMEYGEEKTDVQVVAKRLSKLRQLNNPKKIKGINDASFETKDELSSLREKGLIGYTMENETLVLCFIISPFNHISEDSMILNNIKREFPKTKVIYVRKLYSLHNEITSGEKLHPLRNKPDRYGTVGMIGSFRPKTGETPTMCCISSPHVISAEETAFFKDATVLLGTCIWPPAVPNYEVNVQDISVISLEKRIHISRRQSGEVKLFEDSDRHRLDKRKVFKFGATTDKTMGFVCKTDFVLELGETPINVFLIEPYEKSNEESTFSKPGDSGAVVLTKFGQRVEAFSMIFAGDVNIPEVAKNNTIAVELKHAVDRFEHSHGNILELNTL